MYDGRIRADAWRSLGFEGEPPSREAETRTELVRLLVLAGEQTRAEQFAGGWTRGGKKPPDPAARSALELARRELPPLPHPARLSYRRRLGRIRRLYLHALESGSDSVSLAELAEALGK